MESVRGYLLSVICAAMICGLAEGLVERKSTPGAVLKLIASVFLLFTVLNPVVTLNLTDFSDFTRDIQNEAAAAAAMGQTHTADTMAEIIKSETEAYILDKAAALGGDLRVWVHLNENNLPGGVRLEGDISAYGRFRLESIIQEDLGISKEHQQWNE